MNTVYLYTSCGTMYDYDLPMEYSDDPNFTIETQEESEEEITDEPK